VQPRDADPVPELQARALRAERIDVPDHLVPRHDRQVRQLELALDDVQVGAAAAARVDPDAHLTGAGLGIGALDQLERPAGDRCRRPQYLRPHPASFPSGSPR
jgi:hypothetical protein